MFIRVKLNYLDFNVDRALNPVNVGFAFIIEQIGWDFEMFTERKSGSVLNP